MKRIIEGKAYNTETAIHIAGARDSYEDDHSRSHALKYDLYRTQGGAFFLVEADVLDDGDSSGPVIRFHPTNYDNAYAFASGRRFQVGPYDMGKLQIELYEDGIFPTAAEATEEAGA